MRDKLGLDTEGDAAVDRALASDFLELLATTASRLSPTLSAPCSTPPTASDAAIKQLLGQNPRYTEWQARWLNRLAQRSPAQLAIMQRANPCYIARNHLVENALEAAVDRGDLAPFERLLGVLAEPFDERPADALLCRTGSGRSHRCLSDFLRDLSLRRQKCFSNNTGGIK